MKRTLLSILILLAFAGTGYAASVNTPTVDNGTGTYPNTVTVTASDSTSGSTVCYTSDGSTPTAGTPGTCDQNTYSTPLTFTTTTTLKLLGTKAAMTNSVVLTQVYTIRAPQTWYVSSSAGNDSNAGTSGSRWAHIPGATGCTGTCASTILVPRGYNQRCGRKFVVKYYGHGCIRRDKRGANHPHLGWRRSPTYHLCDCEQPTSLPLPTIEDTGRSIISIFRRPGRYRGLPGSVNLSQSMGRPQWKFRTGSGVGSAKLHVQRLILSDGAKHCCCQ